MAQTSAATTRSSMLEVMDSLCTVTWKQNMVRPGHLSCLGVWKTTISRILGTVTNGLTLCRPPEKTSPFLMVLIPWLILYNQLVLLGRRFIDFQNITLDKDRFVIDKNGCTDLMQRIGVVSQLFWQRRARKNYGRLFKKSPCAKKK